MNMSRNLKQTVTYWAPSGLNKDASRGFASPTTFLARWEDRQELIVMPTGEEITSSAKVFVIQDVANGGWLYLGTSSVADPQTVTGAKEIKAFAKTPNLKATDFERKAWL